MGNNKSTYIFSFSSSVFCLKKSRKREMKRMLFRVKGHYNPHKFTRVRQDNETVLNTNAMVDRDNKHEIKLPLIPFKQFV